ITRIDSKFKRKRMQEIKDQQTYGSFEKNVDEKSLERFRAKPYQLRVAEKMKGEQHESDN
ncbi:MAG: hypothetical protein J6C86_07480, partial [Bacteroidaceae bacterium]|nr:hypothetical protein [Bacteroidaceae bacterium]